MSGVAKFFTKNIVGLIKIHPTTPKCASKEKYRSITHKKMPYLAYFPRNIIPHMMFKKLNQTKCCYDYIRIIGSIKWSDPVYVLKAKYI